MKLFGKDFIEAFTKADMIQVISNFLGDWATKMGYQGPLVRIPNAVDVRHFSQEYSSKELVTTRSELGLSEGDVAVVTTSRLVHKNGVDDVIRAIAKLPEHIKFVIFGNGPDDQKLKKLANELGVSERIVFYGYIDHKVMPRYLKACDIFTRPSRSEGMGNSFVEAMVARLPVIATQEGGIADFLFDAEKNPDKVTTGWAVDADSPDQIAIAVERILSDEDATEKVLKK